MVQEQWKIWEPVSELSKKYNLESFIDSRKELKLLFTDVNTKDSRMLFLLFKQVSFYRITNETARLKTLHAICEERRRKQIDWTFFKVNNSTCLQKMLSESFDRQNVENFTHYLIIDMDSVIDIVSSREPIVGWL